MCVVERGVAWGWKSVSAKRKYQPHFQLSRTMTPQVSSPIPSLAKIPTLLIALRNIYIGQ